MKDLDKIPPLAISVSDPLERIEDATTKLNRIPNSVYGPVTEIPTLPKHSMALALEICNAAQGVYEISLAELGDKPYRLTVRGTGGATNDVALELQHLSKKGRIRHYRFVFRIQADQLTLKWLYKDGSEQAKIEPSEW